MTPQQGAETRDAEMSLADMNNSSRSTLSAKASIANELQLLMQGSCNNSSSLQLYVNPWHKIQRKKISKSNMQLLDTSLLKLIVKSDIGQRL